MLSGSGSGSPHYTYTDSSNRHTTTDLFMVKQPTGMNGIPLLIVDVPSLLRILEDNNNNLLVLTPHLHSTVKFDAREKGCLSVTSICV